MNNMDPLRYQLALDQLKGLDQKTYDSLKAMAFRILDPSPEMYMSAEKDNEEEP